MSGFDDGTASTRPTPHRWLDHRYLLEVKVFRAQAPSQFPCPSQAQWSQLDIQHPDGTVRYGQPLQLTQTSIGDQQQLAFLAGVLPPTARQPGLSFHQSRKQRRSASRAQLLQPCLKGLPATLALERPFGSRPRRLQDRDPDPLAIGLLEPVGQQPLGLGQGTVAAGGRGVIEDHQPKLGRTLPAWLPEEITRATGTPAEQRRHPGNRAFGTRRTRALATACGLARPASGIAIQGAG